MKNLKIKNIKTLGLKSDTEALLSNRDLRKIKGGLVGIFIIGA